MLSTVGRVEVRLLGRRNASDAGRFVVIAVGAVGSTLDEPDVAAMHRTLGLEQVPSPS